MAGKEKIKIVYKNCFGEGDDDNHSAEKELELSLEKPSHVLFLGSVLCTPDASYGSMLVYKRPHVEEFTKFCLEKSEVGMWSSAKEWYLDDALNCTMYGLRNRLLFAWDQDYCINNGFATIENRHKPIFLKELDKIWEKSLGKFPSSNTLLIDDNPYKTLLNPPYTAIFPTEYKASQVGNDHALGTNGALRLYLDRLPNAADVPSHVMEYPFRQPAISATHNRSWFW